MSWSENINSYGIMGCISLALWWPLWWFGSSLPLTLFNSFIWKASFYANLFVMWISWVVLYLVLSRGMDLQEEMIWREVLKSLCLLVTMLFIMDLPLMISQL